MASGLQQPGSEPLLLTLVRGADSGSTPIVHTGREFIYCLEGRITYSVDDVEYVLESGDSLCFEAYLPHRWRNAGEGAARAILVLCPTEQNGSPRLRHFAI
jgi:quercetin dioxygenase-like cupin family protein